MCIIIKTFLQLSYLTICQDAGGHCRHRLLHCQTGKNVSFLVTVNRVVGTHCCQVLNSQGEVLVPHRVQRLRFDLSHLDAPGGQHLLGAGALLQLLLPLPEAELALLLLLHLPRTLAHQDSQHAVGIAVPWRVTTRSHTRKGQ